MLRPRCLNELTTKNIAILKYAHKNVYRYKVTLSRQLSRVPSSDYRHLMGQTHDSLKFSKKKVMIFVRSLEISLKPDSFFLKFCLYLKLRGFSLSAYTGVLNRYH